MPNLDDPADCSDLEPAAETSSHCIRELEAKVQLKVTEGTARHAERSRIGAAVSPFILFLYRLEHVTDFRLLGRGVRHPHPNWTL
jgi:hypothetical protein